MEFKVGDLVVRKDDVLEVRKVKETFLDETGELVLVFEECVQSEYAWNYELVEDALLNFEKEVRQLKSEMEEMESKVNESDDIMEEFESLQDFKEDAHKLYNDAYQDKLQIELLKLNNKDVNWEEEYHKLYYKMEELFE